MKCRSRGILLNGKAIKNFERRNDFRKKIGWTKFLL